MKLLKSDLSIQIIFSEVICKNLVTSSNSYGVWRSVVGFPIDVQINTFCSKIYVNCQARTVNRNFVVSLKKKILTEGFDL